MSLSSTLVFRSRADGGVEHFTVLLNHSSCNQELRIESDTDANPSKFLLFLSSSFYDWHVQAGAWKRVASKSVKSIARSNSARSNSCLAGCSEHSPLSIFQPITYPTVISGKPHKARPGIHSLFRLGSRVVDFCWSGIDFTHWRLFRWKTLIRVLAAFFT